jgi:hypothetical protein
MGNCGGAPKELTLETYMQKYHPPQVRAEAQNNHELNKKVLGGLNGNIFQSEPVNLNSDKYPAAEPQPKVKINDVLLREGLRLGNLSSVSVF